MNTKYLQAIEEAGNLRPEGKVEVEEMEVYRDPPVTGASCGAWRVRWAPVAYPVVAVMASDVAQYAESGLREDNVGPADYVEGLLMLPALGSVGRVRGYEHLFELCEDALARGAEDGELEPEMRERAADMLTWFE